MAHNSSHRMGVFNLRWFGVLRIDVNTVLGAIAEVYADPHVELVVPPHKTPPTKRSVVFLHAEITGDGGL